GARAGAARAGTLAAPEGPLRGHSRYSAHVIINLASGSPSRCLYLKKHPRFRKQCLSQYNDCLKLQGFEAVQFPAVDGAVEWLKAHRTELLVGTVIVIAGVTFVVASAGAGLLVLAPLALVAA